MSLDGVNMETLSPHGKGVMGEIQAGVSAGGLAVGTRPFPRLEPFRRMGELELDEPGSPPRACGSF